MIQVDCFETAFILVSGKITTFVNLLNAILKCVPRKKKRFGGRFINYYNIHHFFADKHLTHFH